MGRHTIDIVLAATLTTAAFATSAAQGVVVTGATSAQYIELRPLVADSVAFALTDSGPGLYRTLPNGSLTQCAATDQFCTFYQPGARTSLAALVQDVDVTAWGLGRGVSVHAQLRVRDAFGDASSLWPQATQTFDALAAYAEYEETRLNARLGRQWVSSGLGMFNFDGASLLLRPTSSLTAQVYGGGSLIQGLDRPLDASALAPVENLPPLDRAWLGGGSLQFRPNGDGSLRVEYQRQLPQDRSVLYSERAALDGEWRTGITTFATKLTRDLATGTFNDAVLSATIVATPTLTSRLEVRHYTPYFDLWTIWGAFSPTGFDEATARLDWTAPVGWGVGGAGGRTTIGISGGVRSYDSTDTGVQTLMLRSKGWRVGVSAATAVAAAWRLAGSYNADIGFGASSTDGDVTLRWVANDRTSIGFNATAFQNLYEFTVAEGRVLGGGADVTAQLRPDLRLRADAMVYHNTAPDDPLTSSWNQRRASLRLEWTVGADPGMAALGGGHAP